MENAREKTAAVVLAAGKGKRMNSDIPKQYKMCIRDSYCINYIIQEIYHVVFQVRPPVFQVMDIWKTKGENL